MAGQFGASVKIDRPVDQVFAYLAEGTNDPEFSPRVLEITKTTDGPTGVGTIFKSRVKDAGMKTDREFEITEFEPPSRIRWAEISKNIVTASEGGYDLAPEGEGTKLSFYNVLEGHGFGKLITGFALSSARKDADNFVARVKTAIEAR